MPSLFAHGAGSLPVSDAVLALAARTTTVNSADLGNLGAAGVVVVINVTAAADTPSVVFTIQGKDTVSGVYYDILSSAAVTGTGTTRLRVHPDLTAAANAAASDLLPDVWRVRAVVADGDSLTYSVGACLVP